MYLIVWLFLIIFGIIYKNSKKIAFIQMSFVVFMFAITTSGPDYDNYLMLFQSLLNSPRNIVNGNVFFNIVLYFLGFTGNYNVALIFISAIMMAVLYKAIIFYTDHISFVLSIYLIAPFVIDIVQVKNFIAMILWFYFSRYLYELYLGKNKIYNTCLYLLGVTIAAGFHFSFVIMYVFILIPLFDLKKIVSLSAIFGAVGVLSFNGVFETIINIMSNHNFAFFRQILSKIHDYTANFNVGKMQTRLLVTLILYIIMLAALIGIYLLKKFKKVENQNYPLEFLINLDCAVAIIFPLMPYSMEVYRVQRNLLLMNYAFMGMFVSKKLIVNGKLRVISLLYTLFCIGISFYYLYIDCIYWNYENVFCQIFKI